MTTFTPMALGPESPFTAIEAVGLYANPIAITEGAAGAPRIMGEAIARMYNGLPVLSVAASDAFDLDQGVVGTVGALTNASTSFVTAYTFNIVLFSGTIRLRASLQAGAGGSVIISCLKNGVEFFATSTSSTSPVGYVSDVAVAPGDELIWRHRSNTGALSTVSAFAIRASNAYVPQTAYRRAV